MKNRYTAMLALVAAILFSGCAALEPGTPLKQPEASLYDQSTAIIDGKEVEVLTLKPAVQEAIAGTAAAIDPILPGAGAAGGLIIGALTTWATLRRKKKSDETTG